MKVPLTVKLSSGHLLLSGDGLGLGVLGYGFGVREEK